MSAQVHLLVKFENGKPSLGLGNSGNSRSYTKKGVAKNYAESAGGDIRILTVTIPDEGVVGEGLWPELLPRVAVSWS
ncbi:Uncharacterised protein [Mycobacteroides abscessus]|nr:Uncharacterised protein [Mycobacteroides abscessus]CPW85245.1 Uncharacterised protein [Mycobacteroides abscessus]SLH92353.1 Uncharacterised protein [Mycobacteroides abscessus subsp. massiliense]SLI30616.1 Uncharacterised protein [Mycobacteroides abscessus subsp. massiliense]